MTAITINIDGEIGRTFWGDGVTASDVGRQLDEDRGATEIHLHLNSPGGDMGETAAIMARLRAHGGRVITHADGWAASAAAVLFAMGEERHASEFSEIMIHRTRTATFRPMTAPDHESAAERLRALDERQIDLFDSVMSADRAEIEAMLDRETWLTATAAKALGLATHVTNNEKPAALGHIPADRYRNTPARALARATQESASMKELERIASHVGCKASVEDITARLTTLLSAEAKLADGQAELAKMAQERDAARADLITAQAKANADECERIVASLRSEGRLMTGSKWEENLTRLSASGNVPEIQRMADLLRETAPVVPVGGRQSTSNHERPAAGALPRDDKNEIDWATAALSLPDGLRSSLLERVRAGRPWAQIAATAAGRAAFEAAGYNMGSV